MTKRKIKTDKAGRRRRRSPSQLTREPDPGRRDVAPIGNSRALKYGGRSVVAMTPTDDDLLEIIDAIAATAPVRDQDGRLPATDEAAVEIAARALKR